MENSEKREYIKALIDHLESQKNFILLFVTFDLTILALILNKSIFNDNLPTLSDPQRVILLTSVFLMSISAGLYMVWHAFLHDLRIKAIDLYVTLDIDSARILHYPGNAFYKRWGWVINFANITMILGIAGLILLIYLRIF